MEKPPTIRNGHDSGRLEPLSDDKQREVMRHWLNQLSDLPGERGEWPRTPDDPVASKLLEAADYAIEHGRLQQGIAILKFVAKEYRHSQEAACARRVIDRLPSSRER